MAAISLKLSEEALKELGFNAAEFESQVLSMFRESAKLKADNDSFSVSIKNVTEKLSAIDKRLTDFEAGTKSLNAVLSSADRSILFEAVKTEAKTAAVAEVSAIIAKAGVNAMRGGAGGDDANAKPGFKEAVAAIKAANPTKKEHEVIAQAIKEFPNEYVEWKKTGGAL